MNRAPEAIADKPLSKILQMRSIKEKMGKWSCTTEDDVDDGSNLTANDYVTYINIAAKKTYDMFKTIGLLSSRVTPIFEKELINGYSLVQI